MPDRPSRLIARSPRPALHGRQGELAEIERFLEGIADGTASCLLLSGPAGIGKTTLWSAGIEAARARGLHVLSARPTEVETGLAFAALGDLLDPLLSPPPPDLPEPQREALDAALLRTRTTAPPHPLGVSLGALGVLRAAGAQRPLVVAIDDVPWLDEASARVLAFMVGRLGGTPVGFLLARRAPSPTTPLPGWLAALPPERLRRLDIGPLSLNDTGALLRGRLGLTLARPSLRRLHAASGGTPFYALELGREVLARGVATGSDTLAVPETLDHLIGARLAALDPIADEVALHAAALAQPTVPVLATALGADRASAGLEAAVAAGVLETAGDAVRFSHPLLAAAAYGRAGVALRRAVHARLADVVTEPEQRARHLSRTTLGPDELVARALEDGAVVAARRGAPEVAAELADDAARLTPPEAAADRARRWFAAADHWIGSGDMGRADEILARIATDVPPGPLQADVLTRRALVALYRSDLELADELLRTAMPMTADDPRRRVAVHALLAGIGHLSWRGWRRARLDMWEALRLATDVGDAALEVQMLGHAATWRFGLGRPWRALMARADALNVPIAEIPALEHPDLQFARLLAREGAVRAARSRLEPLIASARARGDWTSIPRLLVSLAGIELEAGDWDRAELVAEEARAGLLQTGEGAFAHDLLILQLNLAVARGDVEDARARAAALAPQVASAPKPLVRTAPDLALALLEQSLGNARTALDRITPVAAEPGLGRLLPLRWEIIVGIETEALVGLGEVEAAVRRIEPIARRARRRGAGPALAEALRTRAVVLSAAGNADEALRSAEEAVAILDHLELPLRAAHARFTLGEVRRRARQKPAAREALQAALEGFERLGAKLWVDRTRTELARVASRRPPGAPLTETERRVAELAGAGHTNREIADALFMSVHTVEAHLTRIFRALGVTTRTALARADLDAVGHASSDERSGSTPRP